MKKLCSLQYLILTSLMFIGITVSAQTNATSSNNSITMKTYLIEREIPDAGKFTAADLKGISQKSCSVLKDLGTDIKWIHSYVVSDKIYCVYQAANEDIIREHGKQGGFPVTNIMEISSTISPATAEMQ